MVVPQSCRSFHAAWRTHGRPFRWSVLICICLGLVGCQRRPLEFEPDRLSQMRLERALGESLDESAMRVSRLLEQWFGTPDAPRLPSIVSDDPELAACFNLEHIERSAGAVGRGDDQVERGLYRKLCVQCHGISGDGRGPAAGFQSLYPRDFRRGTFKYKSTARGEKPTEDDLLWVLRHGLAGTAMPAFAHWENSKFHTEDLVALAHYVRYLSLRGETERALLLLFGESDALEGTGAANPLVDWPSELISEAERLVEGLARRWAAAEATMVAVPQLPEYLAEHHRRAPPEPAEGVTDRHADGGDGWEIDWEAAAARGAELFDSPRAMCSTCHRLEAGGVDPPRDYDEWTKDWTIRAGIDPDDSSAWRPLKKLGGLKPVKVYPRQLKLGVIRGRSDPSSLYRRLVVGIEGSPMPPLVTDHQQEDGLSEQEIWDLVAWLLWLPRREPPQTNTAQQGVSDAQTR